MSLYSFFFIEEEATQYVFVNQLIIINIKPVLEYSRGQKLSGSCSKYEYVHFACGNLNLRLRQVEEQVANVFFVY